MSIDKAFNESIAYYDDWIKKALPGYDDIFNTAKALLPFNGTDPIRVLDLGAGTGLFSKHVFEIYPNATFVLYDLADKLLGAARDRFSQYRHQFEFIAGDYRNIRGAGKFDLMISSLSIHHLAHDEKKRLMPIRLSSPEKSGRLH